MVTTFVPLCKAGVRLSIVPVAWEVSATLTSEVLPTVPIGTSLTNTAAKSSAAICKEPVAFGPMAKVFSKMATCIEAGDVSATSERQIQWALGMLSPPVQAGDV